MYAQGARDRTLNRLIRDGLRSCTTLRERASSRYLNLVCLPFDSSRVDQSRDLRDGQ